MTSNLLLPPLLALVAALVSALAVDALAVRRGEGAPGFRPPVPGAPWRRGLAILLLTAVFYVGVFLSFALPTGSQSVELDPSAVSPWQLFTLHLILGGTLVAWGLLAHAVPGRSALRFGHRLLGAFRLAEPRPLREVGLGLLAGVAIWAMVLFAVASLAAVLYALGGGDWLPEGAPPLVAFIAGQPLWVRALGSLSAGFFEEVFFRGFLQPRVGIPLSTLLFALAHWSYGEPFMLVGVTLLSLTYAALARWRRSVWAAVTAHAVFDAVQLLVLVPLALEAVEEGTGPLAWIAALPL